jgi:hypothetical protein
MPSKINLPTRQVIDEYLSGKGAPAIGKMFGCSHVPVYRILRENNIASNIHPNTCCFTSELTSLHKEVITGLLLGDGSVYLQSQCKTPFLTVTSIHKQFIEHVVELLPLRWMPMIYIKPTYYTIKGKVCNGKAQYRASSRVDLSLHNFHNCWYKDRIKFVPKTLTLSPTSLRYWFYGDGHTSYLNASRNCVELGLATHGFTFEDAKFLVERLLRNVEVEFHLYLSYGKPRIALYKINSVLRFFEFIGEEPPISCFAYKWKKPYHKIKQKVKVC